MMKPKWKSPFLEEEEWNELVKIAVVCAVAGVVLDVVKEKFKGG